MVFQEIAYASFGGNSVVAYGGMLTFILLCSTATMGYMNTKGKGNINQHKALAIFTLCFAALHGLLVILAKLGL
jgi:hypothetical protein